MDEEQLMELRSSKVEDDKNEVVLSSGNETPKNGGTPKGSWKRALRSQNLNDSTKVKKIKKNFFFSLHDFLNATSSSSPFG